VTFGQIRRARRRYPANPAGLSPDADIRELLDDDQDIPDGFELVTSWVFAAQGYLDLDQAAAAVASAARSRIRRFDPSAQVRQDCHPEGVGVGRGDGVMSRRANGEGTIWRRADGRWCGATYAATNRGGRKRVYVYGKTRAEAREKLTALQRDLDRGVRVSEENWTVQDYLTHWLEKVVRPQRAPKTYQGYELVVRRHIAPILGRRRLRGLSVSDVRQLIRTLEDQGMGARGVQQVHAVLRNGLQCAMRDELIVRNVAKLVQVKTPTYAVGRGLSVEEARALLRGARGERLYALYVPLSI